MTAETDYYGILQVEQDAPAELIETSYRTLARSLRRRVGAKAESPRAALLHEAYRVLSDPLERARYDRQLRHKGQTEARTPREPDPEVCLFCGTAVTAEQAQASDALCECCSSPLSQARRYRFEHSMRRMFRRVERRQHVQIYTKWGTAAIIGTMQNLSHNGMRFISPDEFEANQLIKIDSDMCKALARVSYSQREDSGGFATGVEFVTILLA